MSLESIYDRLVQKTGAKPVPLSLQLEHQHREQEHEQLHVVQLTVPAPAEPAQQAPDDAQESQPQGNAKYSGLELVELIRLQLLDLKEVTEGCHTALPPAVPVAK
eukprot:TRINITY_DN3180_c0_g1_i2.p2 TRINITY_DN3180_c0_g1~~TRINITY_DN3180_c0_g1_i2.p2  ORF type:complete len:105 (-),score=42.12 TRINITY_DN3180_c0_g1_i2:41-355(-)